MFAAVDRFNVVSFWNTRTGKLIYKAILDQNNQIKDAIKFKKQIYAKGRYYRDEKNPTKRY